MTRYNLTPEMLLDAYASGLFPMAEDREDPRLYWVDPDMRGIIPIEGFHIPRRLRRTVRQDPFAVTVDQDFRAVIEACAEAAPGRRSTWINEEIVHVYTELHRLGAAHSVECRRDGELVGGLYGVSLKSAFFGESMFSRATDASKVALVHLVARLKAGGYRLLDAQFVTDHLTQFGIREIPRTAYHRLLGRALGRNGNFYSLPDGVSGAAVVQSITQTS
ncbi:MAG: leucyl/phenylalanyl-tRNA--protein transferase [Minwuiales bacterium]|nr:leucyl/phenylalanyl-tRNA--protein transferase [Minwuiales bacterium]